MSWTVACLSRRLIVEADGPVHFEPEQQRRDAARDVVLAGRGFRILRFSGDLIRSDLAKVVGQIRAALEAGPDAYGAGPLPTPGLRQGPPSPARGRGG